MPFDGFNCSVDAPLYVTVYDSVKTLVILNKALNSNS